jgi:hypothetical protein
MKLISILSATALVGLGVSAFALSFSAPAFGTYAASASLLVVLGAVRDYTPRRSYWEPGHGRTTRFPAAPARRQIERLAA